MLHGDQLPLSRSWDDSRAVTLEGWIVREDKSQIFISCLCPFSIYLILDQQEPIGGEKNIFLKMNFTIGQPSDVAYDSLFSCWPLKASWGQLQLWLHPRDRAAWGDLTAIYFLVICHGTSLIPHNLSPSSAPSTKLWPKTEISEEVKTCVAMWLRHTDWLDSPGLKAGILGNGYLHFIISNGDLE